MLEIKNLTVHTKKDVPILSDISLTIGRGECVGLTGASGSGKTTLIKTILGMQDEELVVSGGKICLDGRELLTISAKEKRLLCGKVFGFVPQIPMTAFFPHARIGGQMEETFRLLTGLKGRAVKELTVRVLKQVNLEQTDRIMNAYPGELSGGMLQRIAMALVLGAEPSYILADEPTSALDESNRNQLIELLRHYKVEAGILFISHDAGAIKSLCHFVHVMEQGHIIETQPTEELFTSPVKPWTKKFAEAANGREEVAWKWTALN